MAPFAVKVIRHVFDAGEHIAPSLAGRAAFRLFCRTPNANRMTEGEQHAVQNATDFMAKARLHRLKIGKGWIAAHEFLPHAEMLTAQTVLLVHGWRSRTEYMRTLAEGYRDAGYRVISLDLPGHGHSSGRYLTMINAVEAISLAAQQFGPFEAVVGHSFGGAVAVNAAVGSIKGIAPIETKRLVLIASPSSLPSIFAGFSNMLNVGPRSQAVMAEHVEQLAGRPLSDFHGDRQLATMQLPTLVIHAQEDREVSADQARSYEKAGEHVQLYWANGLGHRRILSNRDVVERAVTFVREPSQMVGLNFSKSA